MVFYEQQSVELLKQISTQLSSAFPQPSVPSPSPLPPLSSLTANPSSSDKLINALWFTSLVLSLSAALLATLVQRWARKHMQIFHRYKHPLKLSRIRQYLYEGIENGHMSMIAEAVPALIHISLFLFLVGLADSLLNAELLVAIPAMCAIGLYFVVYGAAALVPVFIPQFPLHNSFSVLIWFLIQAFPLRKYKDRIDGERKPVSQNMTDGQVELALENNPARKDRDRRAIAWLAGDITEDSEMESFAESIPGSFDPEWGVHVWGNRPSNGAADANLNKSLAIDNYDLLYSPSWLRTFWRSLKCTHPTPSNTMGSSSASHPHPLQVKGFPELCKRIGRLVQTCNSPYLFVNEPAKRDIRSRVCVESAALLVFRMKADLSWFGDMKVIGKVLRDQGYGNHPELFSATSSSQAFAANWTGLSIATTRKLLNTKWTLMPAEAAFREFGKNRGGATTLARKMDSQFRSLWDHVETRDNDPRRREEDNLQLVEIQRDVRQIEARISDLRTGIQRATYGLSEQFPWNELKEMTRTANACDFLLNPTVAQLNYLRSRFDTSTTPASPELAAQHGVQQVAEQDTEQQAAPPGQGAEQSAEQGAQQGVEQDMQEDAEPDGVAFPRLHRPTERQIWRFLDLCEGGAVGFTLELYLLSLREILSASASPPEESHDVCVGAFKNITSNRSGARSNPWTQKVILELICDIAAKRGVFSDFTYPGYIEDELVELLRKVTTGMQDLPDIEHAIDDLEREPVRVTVQPRGERPSGGFREKVLGVLRDPHVR
jgi:Family of unknown function (DUF6535)